MVTHGFGRLPVVARAAPTRLVGIPTRRDVLSDFRGAIDEDRREPPTITVPRLRRRSRI